MPVERRGQTIRVMVNLANWQQEEPTGCGGGRELSMDGTSRVTGDCHARFCERLGVKFPGPTRRRSAMAVPTATPSLMLEYRRRLPHFQLDDVRITHTRPRFRGGGSCTGPPCELANGYGPAMRSRMPARSARRIVYAPRGRA
jgi:hypothetical protein